MKVARNLLVGVAGSLWSALIGLAVVPFYLKYLGVEAYGLIGFFMTAQAVLSILDMGLAPTINREVARCSATGNLSESGKLLHTLALVYWLTALAIVFMTLLLAPGIADYWLQADRLSPQTISRAVMLMGVVVAIRWPIGLYQGALMGAQRLALSSAISVSLATVGSLGAVVVLEYVSPSIEAFFAWQALVGLALALAMRSAAWRVIGRAKTLRFETEALRKVWRFSIGMSGVAISGVILMQLDKIILSKILSLEDFGRYALAGVIANGLYVLLTPTFNIIYPRLSALVVTGNISALLEIYRVGTRLLLSVLFPIATTVAVYAEEILLLWTGNSTIATRTAPVVSFFLVGTALNGVMHFPYALQLAYGKTRLPLLINAILVLSMIPVTVFLSMNYGATGGAAAWAILNIAYLIIGTILTHRILLKGIGLKWIISDVGFPLCISILVIGGVCLYIQTITQNPMIIVAIGSLSTLAATAVIIMLSSNLRILIQAVLKEKLT